MFSIFKKKTPIEKLEINYKNLLREAHQLSTSNRALSDQKVAEAQKVMDEIDRLTKASANN